MHELVGEHRLREGEDSAILVLVDKADPVAHLVVRPGAVLFLERRLGSVGALHKVVTIFPGDVRDECELLLTEAEHLDPDGADRAVLLGPLFGRDHRVAIPGGYRDVAAHDEGEGDDDGEARGIRRTGQHGRPPGRLVEIHCYSEESEKKPRFLQTITAEYSTFLASCQWLILLPILGKMGVL